MTLESSNASPNPLVLAAENPPMLLPLLRSNPSLAAKQDEHGYSLLHAAASYNHLNLARDLENEFKIDPNIRDEDEETALFVVETVEAARCLVEVVGTDPEIKNAEGLTAEEKIRVEGDFVAVADFLKEFRLQKSAVKADPRECVEGVDDLEHPPPVPNGIQLQVGTLEDEQNLGEVVDPELKERIEELASREDFPGQEGQRQLRNLIADAVRGIGDNQREIRRRVE